MSRDFIRQLLGNAYDGYDGDSDEERALIEYEAGDSYSSSSEDIENSEPEAGGLIRLDPIL